MAATRSSPGPSASSWMRSLRTLGLCRMPRNPIRMVGRPTMAMGKPTPERMERMPIDLFQPQMAAKERGTPLKIPTRRSKLLGPKSKPLRRWVQQVLWWRHLWWIPKSKVSTCTSSLRTECTSSTKGTKWQFSRMDWSYVVLERGNGVCKTMGPMIPSSTLARKSSTLWTALTIWPLGFHNFIPFGALCCFFWKFTQSWLNPEPECDSPIISHSNAGLFPKQKL